MAACLLSCLLPAATHGDTIPSACRPAPVQDPTWIKRFGREQHQLESRIDVCFVGDSLTQFWETEGRPILDLEFRGLYYTNLGIAADRTENILYRIQNLNFDKARPRVFVLLAGTNNLAKSPPDSPEDTAKGIQAILDSLKEKSPDSKVILISILPNGNEPSSDLRSRIRETNQLIGKFADSRVRFLDVYSEFLKDDKTWKSNLTVDNTHLSLHGYDVLGIKLRKEIDEILKANRG